MPLENLQRIAPIMLCENFVSLQDLEVCGLTMQLLQESVTFFKLQNAIMLNCVLITVMSTIFLEWKSQDSK